MIDSPENTFLDTHETARLLRASYNTLCAWRRLGRGPAYTKVGSLVRYRLSDVQEWAAARRQLAGARDAA